MMCVAFAVSQNGLRIYYYTKYVCTRLRHSAPSKQNRRESIRLSERAAIRTAMADAKLYLPASEKVITMCQQFLRPFFQ